VVKIVTDSTADLTPELIEKYQIGVVPLNVCINDQSFKDGIDLQPEQLFAMVDETNTLPKTAAPAIVDFIKEFKDSEESLYIGLSSKLSSTIQNSYLAREEVGEENVEIVDSLNLSCGIGILVLKAVDLRNQGLSLAEIKAEIEKLVPRVRTSFVVETLRYLYLGGRCSALASIFGSVLKVRPVIEVKQDGTMGVKAKVRGKRSKVVEYLLEDFKANLERIDLDRVIVTHAACPDDASYLKEQIEAIAQPKEVLITTAGCVISSHCGPETVGVIYLEKE